ncbi:hypothetical protein CR513_27361, partial [Mucuna pruriens]
METTIRDLAKQQEVLKNDVRQLKAQIGQIVEMLKSMSNQGALEQPQATPYHVTSNQTSHQGPYCENSGAQTVIPPHAHPGEDSQSARILQLLEERLDALEGFKHTGFDAVDLCLFPCITIPPNFELLTFDKYRGTSYPRSHLTMYYSKMTPYTHDDTLLIHFFQESLTGVALKWYLGLRCEHIPTWRSLAESFLNQYKYNMDMALDHSQLQNMAKGEKEAFKEYAKHWMELVTRIQPPLSDKEMVTMFIDTLRPLFYEKMVGNVSSNFVNLLLIEERVEVGMKKGRIVLEAATSHIGESYDSEKGEGTNLATTLKPQILAP